MDPDPAPNPDPTPDLSLVALGMQKKFSYFFLITYPQEHYLQSYKFNCLINFVLNLFCKHYVSPLNIFMRKGKDPEPEPDLKPDPDSYL